jgi:recombination protein RecR
MDLDPALALSLRVAVPLEYPAPIQRAMAQLKSLPSVGPRSAERMALWLLQSGAREILSLAAALQSLAREVEMCAECGFYSQLGSSCLLCTNEQRSGELLCVVEQAADVLRMERSRAYQGQYHVLGGKLSPLDNVTPADLRISELLRRVQQGGVKEVILALGSDVEGEATANYLAHELRSLGVQISRLAQGMPAGGGLDHVDELTLFQALNGRRTL